MKGYTISENALGFTAIRLHYSADPDKDPDTEAGSRWVEQQRRLYPDPNQWQQEFEINWWMASGIRVFPEFTETRHCQALTHRGRKVIYRAWDFGWLTPACLVAQIDAKDRLVILREIVGNQQTTKEFATQVIDVCSQHYPHHTAGFQDFCDPAGQQASSTASERSEVRDVEILRTLSIYPSWEYGWNRKHGRALIHQLLGVRTDDTPSMYVDGAQCPTVLQAFLGRYVYPGTKTGHALDEPDETNHPWSDVMACLRYLATGLYSALGLIRFRSSEAIKKDEPVTYHGYGTPVGRRTLWPSERS